MKLLEPKTYKMGVDPTSFEFLKKSYDVEALQLGFNIYAKDNIDKFKGYL